MAMAVNAPSLGATFVHDCVLRDLLQSTCYSAFFDGFQRADTFSYDHAIGSVLRRFPAFVHDPRLMPVIILRVGFVCRVPEGHEAMAVLVAPVLSIVQWTYPLVSKDASDSIRGGSMDEVHLAVMPAFTAESRLIWKIQPENKVVINLLLAFRLILKPLESLDGVWFITSFDQDTGKPVQVTLVDVYLNGGEQELKVCLKVGCLLDFIHRQVHGTHGPTTHERIIGGRSVSGG